MKALTPTLEVIFRPIIILKDYPVVLRYGNIYFVTIGIIAAVSAVLSLLCATYFYRTMFPAETSGNYFMWEVASLHVSSLIFSKIFHFFALGSKFLRNPAKHLTETAFYNQGGQLGVLIATIWISFNTGIDFFACMDINLTAGCLALAIGRIGCYNYGCCHGRPTSSRYSTVYTNPDSKVLRVFPELANVPLVPTQLVSAAFSFVLFFTMVFILFMGPTVGIVSAFFIIVYNSFRYYIERYRISVIDLAARTTNIRLFRWMATLLVVFGLVYLGIVLWAPPRHLAFVAPLTMDEFFTHDVFRPQAIAILAVIFFIYALTWGVHYKKLGQHFAWKNA